MTVEHELLALRELHDVVERAAQDLERIAGDLDRAVGVELWTGRQADELRSVWLAQRRVVRPTLTSVLRASAADVRTQHNNLAAAVGRSERL
ncbi:hypothetical protein GCM10009584_12320 [Ornithinimicrobium humiphilum]|uniref:Uncharacterized protein n=1 Tax=Ornithinimicrobium humiphilum TaxID=125288 RepID=A0A543KJT1_9MICO|nr:hypothetical protein [Ornithinimicrobium humiphilum]TQM95335.1 hypothetical protein FB476_0174 [Ornithinimicrobium humiphilum]